jgi:MFS family permease
MTLEDVPMQPPSAAAHPPGLRGWRRVLVWAIAAAAIVAIPASVLAFGDPGTLGGFVTLGTAMVFSFAGVGALIATRQPGNAVGWLLFAAGVILAINLVGSTFAANGVDVPGGPPAGTALVAWFVSWTFFPAISLVGIYVPVLFPDGHPPSNRARWKVFLVLTAIALAFAQVPTAFGIGPLPDYPTLQNPFGFLASEDATVFELVNVGSAAVAFPIAFAAPIIRFRRSTGMEREQLKWLGFVGLATIGTLTMMLFGTVTSDSDTSTPVADLGWILFLVGVALIPVAIGIAILRYRLYDIDRLVSRTIAYGLVTGGLVAVYLAVNLALSSVFSAVVDGNAIVVAASTLAAAALFTPLRRRVQRAVDRRFDRAHYDAESTTIAFSTRLRNEVDLSTVAADLETTVRDAIAPTTLSLWLRPEDAR